MNGAAWRARGAAAQSPGSAAARPAVCRWLIPAQREGYRAWTDNDQRLRDLLARIEALGAAASKRTRASMAALRSMGAPLAVMIWGR